MNRGRPKYLITKSDFKSAYLYLERNYTEYSFQRLLCQVKTPEQLQQLCDNNLTPYQWKKLKTTIFAERKRDKDSAPGKQKKNITLSPDAFQELELLQYQIMNITGTKFSYSELIKAAFSRLNDDMPIHEAKYWLNLD